MGKLCTGIVYGRHMGPHQREHITRMLASTLYSCGSVTPSRKHSFQGRSHVYTHARNAHMQAHTEKPCSSGRPFEGSWRSREFRHACKHVRSKVDHHRTHTRAHAHTHKHTSSTTLVLKSIICCFAIPIEIIALAVRFCHTLRPPESPRHRWLKSHIFVLGVRQYESTATSYCFGVKSKRASNSRMNWPTRMLTMSRTMSR